LGIIIRAEYKSDNIVFFTDDNSSQQLGYMQRPKDYNILPHRHNLVQREVHLTQEVLYIKSGLVRVDFYNNDQHYLESRILKKGDVILLSDGGHGFKMMEQSEIIEVKQGPYCGERDKVRFDPIDEAAIILKDNEQ
jgi:cupin superfamily acireductone dioxygenase involved in methionine salvage